jgi:menaquinone-dependent protoporphyrinogen oxidase
MGLAVGKDIVMSDTVLVTYATRTGSTAGVAEAIGKTLSAQGLNVVVRPMAEVDDITPYRAVIAGSPIQSQAWLPEATRFMRTNQAALAKRPTAIFTVCMTVTLKGGQYREAVMEWIAPIRVLVQPFSEGLFAGVLDIGQIPSFGDRLKFRISTLTGVWKEGDHRDWNAIAAWAKDLVPQIQGAAV